MTSTTTRATGVLLTHQSSLTERAKPTGLRAATDHRLSPECADRQAFLLNFVPLIRSPGGKSRVTVWPRSYDHRKAVTAVRTARAVQTPAPMYWTTVRLM